ALESAPGATADDICSLRVLLSVTQTGLSRRPWWLVPRANGMRSGTRLRAVQYLAPRMEPAERVITQRYRCDDLPPVLDHGSSNSRVPTCALNGRTLRWNPNSRRWCRRESVEVQICRDQTIMARSYAARGTSRTRRPGRQPTHCLAFGAR